MSTASSLVRVVVECAEAAGVDRGPLLRERGDMYLVDFDAGASLFTSSPELERDGGRARSVGAAQPPLPPSGLARVDLQTAEVTAVTIDGEFADLSPLSGADGMTLVDGELYVAFTTRLARVTPTLPDWSEATSVIEDAPGGLTDVVLTPGGLYLQNGQSVTFALGAAPEPFMLVRYTGGL